MDQGSAIKFFIPRGEDSSGSDAVITTVIAPLDDVQPTATEAERPATSPNQHLDSDDVDQVLSQVHTGFSVWLGEPFHDQESSQFVARYIERGPLSLEKLSLPDFAEATSGNSAGERASPKPAWRRRAR